MCDTWHLVHSLVNLSQNCTCSSFLANFHLSLDAICHCMLYLVVCGVDITGMAMHWNDLKNTALTLFPVV